MTLGPGVIGADGWRDMFALTLAFLRDDSEGEEAILANTDPLPLARAAVAFTAGTLTFAAEALGLGSPEEALSWAEDRLAGGLRVALAFELGQMEDGR